MLKPEFKTSARTVQWADRLAFMHNLINVVVGPFIAVVSLSTRNVSKYWCSYAFEVSSLMPYPLE